MARSNRNVPPDFESVMIRSGKEGKHITDFLIELGLNWEQHTKQLEVNKKYKDTFQAYQKHCEEYWFNLAHKAMTEKDGQGFNTRLWSLIMRNKFQHWTESTNVDLTTQGQKISSEPIQIEIIKNKLLE